ncbi:sugar phosphate isomerase/epimerase family protein [[Ruminococcus] torques]|nr:D-tagatose 3-epimerase [uncultured Ruminococcus sp.]
MKFGTLYSYWGTKWQCDYLKTLKRVSDIGFDILEMGAPHLLEMSDYELSELRRAAKDMDMVLTANIGPAKDKDLASPDPDIRKAGVNYLIDILKAMEKVGSKSLVGAMYSYWPCQFEITDKEAAWERSIEGMKEVAEAAESLGIECCQEVLNRYETYIITDCREGLEYCRRVGSENVNLLLDTFH